jgi:hypothetical protein
MSIIPIMHSLSLRVTCEGEHADSHSRFVENHDSPQIKRLLDHA